MAYLSFHAGTKGKVNSQNKKMVSGHTFRKTEQRFKTHKNENIDPSKTHENIDFFFYKGQSTDMRMDEIIDKRIEEDYKRKHPPRKNAVLAREIIIQPSVDEFEFLTEDEKKERMTKFVNHSLGWLGDEFTTDNILGGSIHYDETNPHAHIWIMPMTDDGGLVQKEFFRGPGGLVRMHKEYREHMNNLGWDFETENKYENAEHFDYEMMQKHGDVITSYREDIKALDAEKQLKAEEYEAEVIKMSNEPLIRSEAEKKARGTIIEELLPKYKKSLKKSANERVNAKIEEVEETRRGVLEYKDNLQHVHERMVKLMKMGKGTDYNKERLINYLKTGESFVAMDIMANENLDVDQLAKDVSKDDELEL